MFARVALLVLKKDVAIELRSYEIISTTVFFAAACVTIFSFAFARDDEAMKFSAAGILWIAVAFSGTLALSRTFERERYGETLKALLMAPAPRPAIYLGKLLGVIALLLATEVLVVPMVALLFHSPLFERPWLFVGLLVTGTVGYAAVGTLFAAMLVRARTRDVMLPILLYPITIPVIIAGVEGTTALLQSPIDDAMATLWLALLAFFDVVFITLSLWMFEPLMTE
ncbi:MAG: heme exporter protein CcmB [Vicinamibacterales bacterium]